VKLFGGSVFPTKLVQPVVVRTPEPVLVAAISTVVASTLWRIVEGAAAGTVSPDPRTGAKGATA
jgi:hypothetical protein